MNHINAFTVGRDIHTETASKIFKVDLERVSREMRKSNGKFWYHLWNFCIWIISAIGD